MDDGERAVAQRRRTTTCDRRTAPAIARALLRLTLLTRRFLGVVAFFVVIGAIIVADDHPHGPATLFGIALPSVFLGIVVVFYTRIRRATRFLYPAGATMSVELGDDAITLHSTGGDGVLPYGLIEKVTVVGGNPIITQRADPAVHNPLPAGLLTADDLAWLRERVATAEPISPTRPLPGAGMPDDSTDDGRVREIVISEDTVRRYTRALRRYRLKRIVPILTVAWLVGILLVADDGYRILLALLGVPVISLLALLRARSIRRYLEKRARVGGRVRCWYDDTHLHVDIDGTPGSMAYSNVRRVRVDGDVVLLSLRTGTLQLLPRELVPDEALRLMGSAKDVASGTTS